MTDLFAEYHPIAVSLLEEFGVLATITRSGSAEPATRTAKLNGTARAGSTAATLTGLGVVGTQERRDDQGRVSTVQIATLLVEPRAGDILTIGADRYVVGDVTRIAPQGKAIIYTAVLTS